MDLTEAEFRSLFDEFYVPLRAYVARRVPNASDAEDVVVEIFSVVWRRRTDVPSAPSDRRMWLYGVARLTVVNQRRSSARSARLRHRVAAQAATTQSNHDPDDPPGAATAMEALSSLRENDQELIRLSVWEEFTHAEIAEVVRTSTPNVAVRLHRAKRRLRREFHRLMQEADEAGQVAVEMSTALTGDEEATR